MAFYAGGEGATLLMETIDYIPKDIPIILDGKRADIGNTARQYANEIFEVYGADATTVNPYLGIDGIEPFLEYREKCSFVLCRTSNPSARDFQDLIVGRERLYQIVARKIKEWNRNGSCGAVVGATYPKELRKIRGILGNEIPILIPGIGKQGGDLERAVRYGINEEGRNAIINSSRSVLYASSGKDFAKESRRVAEELRERINLHRF
jgi:orotidine-5'-phosphate decarboxylase